MSDLLQSMVAASSGMDAQTTRLRLVSENIANADTPGFRRKTITFEEAYHDADKRAVVPGRVFLDRSELEQVYDPAHPMADEDGYFEGSNVDLVDTKPPLRHFCSVESLGRSLRGTRQKDVTD
ncbi:MAG: flagellar basal body protein [Pseudomonadota bacterium]